MQQQSFVFIGRAGAGKGTQAKRLIEVLNKKDPAKSIIMIETGVFLRKLAEGSSYTSKRVKEIIDAGGLTPAFMPIYLWAAKLVEKFTGNEHVIFDGTPRLLAEAKMLDSVFPFYGMGKPWIIYLDIDHDESLTRLIKRAGVEGRKDDTKEGIEQRKIEFETNVKPTVEHYRNNPNVNFLDIDGERSIEVIHADIVKRLGL